MFLFDFNTCRENVSKIPGGLPHSLHQQYHSFREWKLWESESSFVRPEGLKMSRLIISLAPYRNERAMSGFADTPPETNNSPTKKGWLWDDPFHLVALTVSRQWTLHFWEVHVLGRVGYTQVIHNSSKEIRNKQRGRILLASPNPKKKGFVSFVIKLLDKA